MCYENKKTCALYASLEHLVTILVSYIYEKENLEENIITFFEEDLEDIAIRINKNRVEKKENKNIWKKTEITELGNKIKTNLKGKIIVVCGSDKYIKSVNMILDNINESFEVINCFNILKNKRKIQDIINNYSKILTTQGIEKIKKIVTYNA